MSKSSIGALAGGLTLAVCYGASAGSWAPPPGGYGKFEFALIGDTPYGSVQSFEKVVDEINGNSRIAFVLHAGDIKTGSSQCSDDLYLDRYQRFQGFEAPLILTPGDNEWTDCHRVNNGEYQPLERLAKLREVFFTPAGQSLGKRVLKTETQGGEFIENVRWSTQHVTFATLHIVGSNNALAPFDPNSSVVRSAADDAEVARRVSAAVDWINSTYAHAAAQGDLGVLFLFQANPEFELPSSDPARAGFNEILEALIDGAKTYGKPVILAHGDSHYFRIDKPVRAGQSAVSNITRVETFGSSDYHWLRVEVDPKSAEVFTIHQEIVD